MSINAPLVVVVQEGDATMTKKEVEPGNKKRNKFYNFHVI